MHGLDLSGGVELLDTDLSTITAAAEKLFRCLDPDGKWILHLEFVSRKDLSVPVRLNLYVALAINRYDLPIYSVVVVLCARAGDPSLTGYYERKPHHGRGGQICFYRLWRPYAEGPDALLKGPIGTLALAVVSDVPIRELPGLIRQIELRVEAELPPEEQGEFWTAALVLLGVRMRNRQGPVLAGRVRPARMGAPGCRLSARLAGFRWRTGLPFLMCDTTLPIAPPQPGSVERPSGCVCQPSHREPRAVDPVHAMHVRLTGGGCSRQHRRQRGIQRADRPILPAEPPHEGRFGSRRQPASLSTLIVPVRWRAQVYKQEGDASRSGPCRDSLYRLGGRSTAAPQTASLAHHHLPHVEARRAVRLRPGCRRQSAPAAPQATD
jgi:hypothetical protein